MVLERGASASDPHSATDRRLRGRMWNACASCSLGRGGPCPLHAVCSLVSRRFVLHCAEALQCTFFAVRRPPCSLFLPRHSQSFYRVQRAYLSTRRTVLRGLYADR